MLLSFSDSLFIFEIVTCSLGFTEFSSFQMSLLHNEHQSPHFCGSTPTALASERWIAHAESEVGTETVVMTCRQGLRERRNVSLMYAVFTVQPLGTVNTWAWRLYTTPLKCIAKGVWCFFSIDHQNFSFINSFKIEPWCNVIWISFISFVNRWNFKKLSLSLQPFDFFYYFQNCSALSLVSVSV